MNGHANITTGYGGKMQVLTGDVKNSLLILQSLGFLKDTGGWWGSVKDKKKGVRAS